MTPFLYEYVHQLLQINEVIVENTVPLQVNTLAELLQTSSVIGSATQDSNTVSVKNLVSTSIPGSNTPLYKHMSATKGWEFFLSDPIMYK